MLPRGGAGPRYRTWWAAPDGPGAAAAADGTGPGGWEPLPGTVVENDDFLVEADPARGGALARVTDKRSGTELLRGLGNELVVQEEYDYHPRWGEGPWLLSPKGPGTGSGAAAAKVTAQRCPLGARLVAELALGDLRIVAETLLWDGTGRVDFRTHVDGSIGQDRLLRVRFPADVPGGLPVYATATAVVGRPFGSRTRTSRSTRSRWTTRPMNGSAPGRRRGPAGRAGRRPHRARARGGRDHPARGRRDRIAGQPS